MHDPSRAPARKVRLFLTSVIALSLGPIFFAAAAPTDQVQVAQVQAAQVQAAQNAGPPEYRPPVRGAPQGRVGGATRGLLASEAIELDVLAPDHVGHTTREQPTLYWYNSRAVDLPVMLTVTAADAEKPLIEIQLPRPMRAGINAFELAGTPARLAVGTEYDWSVAIVTDRAERSKDVAAGGIVKRVADGAGAAGNAAPAVAARNYAAAGLWYDAVDVLSRGIARAPADSTLRRDRSALLDQVGLAKVAAYDRQAAAR